MSFTILSPRPVPINWSSFGASKLAGVEVEKKALNTRLSFSFGIPSPLSIKFIKVSFPSTPT